MAGVQSRGVWIAELHVYILQKAGSLQEVISHTHTCLGSSKHRLEGLLLLERLIGQSNTDVFTKHVHTWLKLLLQTLQSRCPVAHHQMTSRVAQLLLAQCGQFPELTREVAGSYIPQLVPLLLAASVQWVGDAIGCINVCIRNFPGACGPFKGKIEPFILPYLDQEYPVQEALACFALLAQCGGSGNLGVKHTEGWSKQCDKLLASLTQVLTAMYSGVELEESEGGNAVGLTLSPVPELQPHRGTWLVTRYEMLTGCLVKLLSEDFPAVAKVPLKDILKIACRALAVNNNMLLSRPTSERLMLSYILPSVHVSTLKLVSPLILCGRKMLIPYNTTINKLLTQSLVWTHTAGCTSDQEKPYSKLRETVYSVACDWLKALGACANMGGSVGADFIKELLSDIKVQADTLKIDNRKQTRMLETEGPSSAKRKKKSGGGYQEISHSMGLQRKSNKLVRHKLCLTALEALRWLLHTNGTTVTPSLMKDIQSCLMTLTLNLQQTQKGDYPTPYGLPACRTAVYKVVLALVLVPHPTCPPPVHLAVRIFSHGLADSNIEVCGCCREALSVCEVLIHPRAPCLQSPLQLSAELILIGTTNTSGEPGTGCKTSNTKIGEQDRDIADSGYQSMTGSGTKAERSTRVVPTAIRTMPSEKTVKSYSSPVSSSVPAMPYESSSDSNDDDSRMQIGEATLSGRTFIGETTFAESSNINVAESLEIGSHVDENTETVESSRLKDADPHKDFASGLSDQSRLEEIDPQPSTSRDMLEVGADAPAYRKPMEREGLTVSGLEHSSVAHQRTEELNEDVKAMLSSFVDAGPDSDSSST